jgi:hypothetical protein
VNVPVVYVELRSPTANGYGGVRLKGFLPDNHFFNENIPGKKPKAATQRGFALPVGMRSMGVAPGSAKGKGLCQRRHSPQGEHREQDGFCVWACLH